MNFQRKDKGPMKSQICLGLLMVLILAIFHFTLLFCADSKYCYLPVK